MFIRKAWCFFQRDMLESLSFKTRSLLDAGSIVFNCVLFYFIGLLIDQSPQLSSKINGTDYFPFVLTGLALCGLQTSALESFSRAIYREQGAGTLEAILITPTSLSTVVLSNLFWSSTISLLRFFFYFLLGTLFFHLDMGHCDLLSASVVLILTFSSLSGLGLISAGFILWLKRADPLNYLINGGSKILSGVYFPLSLLPAWLQHFSYLFPLTSSLTALREALFKGASLHALERPLFFLLCFSLLALPLGLSFFSWALRKAKEDGTLIFN